MSVRIGIALAGALLLGAIPRWAAAKGAVRPSGPPPRQITEPMLGPYVRPPYDEHAQDDETREDYRRVHRVGPRHHGGFYLRLAGGIGFGSDGAESGDSFENPKSGDPARYDARASGFAYATEIAVGFTALPGTVIGAGVYTVTLPSPTAGDVNLSPADYDFEVSQLALFAPHLDFYPMPERGLHFQAGVGVATLVMGQAIPTQGPDARAHTAVGPGFMLGIGHEWFVGPEWSMGLCARMLYAWSSGTDPESVDWSHNTVAPTLMITATYH